MIKSLTALCKRGRGESGAILLLTVVFMMTVGVAAIVVLWGMGYTAGAYEELYSATQSAAYAAATEVSYGQTSENGNAQLQFDCGAAVLPACDQGRSYEAATSLLNAQLKGKFGLTYPGNVELLDQSLQPTNSILAYQIPVTPALAQSLDPTCIGTVTPPDGQPFTSCWTIPGTSSAIDKNYISGVVVADQATIQLIPGCHICGSFTIKAIAAARTGQQLPGSSFGS